MPKTRAWTSPPCRCRYAHACQQQDLTALLAKETPGYAGRLSSTHFPGLRAEIGRTWSTDCRQLVDWLATTTDVTHSVSGLTGLLHRQGFCYKLATKQGPGCA